MDKQDLDLEKWYKDSVEDLKNDPEFIAQGIMMDLAIQIADYLKEHNLKQKDLAEKLGKSQGWVSRFLNAPTNFSVLKLVEIATALGIKLNVRFEIDKEFQEYAENPGLVAEDSADGER